MTRQQLAQLNRARKASETAHTEWQARRLAYATAIAELARDGMTYRELADATGLTRQRVQQIAKQA
jgi:predicted transcriptional regulator